MSDKARSFPNPLLVNTHGRLWHWPATRTTALSCFALHGWTGSGLDFESRVDCQEDVEGDFWAVDLPGHGDTSEQSAHSTAQVLSFLEEAWKTTGEQAENCVLLGYSMGGRMALQWALDTPERWAAVVLIGATPGLEAEKERLVRQASDEQRARRIEEVGAKAFWKEWRQHPLIASQLRMKEPWLSRLEARRLNNSTAGLAASLRGYGTGSMPSGWERLEHLKRPVLLITGQEDSKFNALAERMVSLLPQAQHRSIAGAGHAPHLEQPETTWQVISQWTKKWK